MAETIQYKMDQSCSENEETYNVGEAQASLAGFKHLYLRWLPPVYRYLYFRTRNAKDTEDLTAQVFLKVYEELPRYRERGQFPAWLFTIVRNQAVDYFRSRSREVPLENEAADGTNDLLSQVAHTLDIQRLRSLIRSLPEQDQELIRLRFVAGLGYREIGAVLNRKEDAVRKSTTRLLARLRSQLETNHE